MPSKRCKLWILRGNIYLDLRVSEVLSEGSFVQLYDILFFSDTKQVSCLGYFPFKILSNDISIVNTFNTSIGGRKFFILKLSTLIRDVELIGLYIIPDGGSQLKCNICYELIESLYIYKVHFVCSQYWHLCFVTC